MTRLKPRMAHNEPNTRIELLLDLIDILADKLDLSGLDKQNYAKISDLLDDREIQGLEEIYNTDIEYHRLRALQEATDNSFAIWLCPKCSWPNPSNRTKCHSCDFQIPWTGANTK